MLFLAWILLCHHLLLLSTYAEAAVSVDNNGNPVVQIRQGLVGGNTQKSLSGRSFYQFLAIPFGQIPRRFQAPLPADPWEGQLNATQDGVECKQVDTLFGRGLVGDENCLNVNVFVPKRPGKKLPVIVYLYEGAFIRGTMSSLAYGPQVFMDFDVVLVVSNYRVGFFGFFSTGDRAAPGNYGLWDQQLAMRWVRDNVGAFGGDPNRVTLFGQSSGAASAFFHMMAPSSQGLFGAAILQSGSGLCPWAINPDPEVTARSLGQQFRCNGTDDGADTEALVECLRNVDGDSLAVATSEYLNQVAPVVDGDFFQEHPYVTLKEGKFRKVPVISGVVRDEFALLYPDFISFFTGTATEISAGVRNLTTIYLGSDFLGNHPGLEDAVIGRYFDGVDYGDTEEVRRTAIEMFSDLIFLGCNNLTMDLLASQDVTVYSYVFDYLSPAIPTLTGRQEVHHFYDVFFNFQVKLLNRTHYSDRDRAFIRTYDGFLVNLAYSRNPTPQSLYGPRWRPIQYGGYNGYMLIDQQMQMQRNFRPDQMRFWQDVLLTRLEEESR